MKTNRFSLQRRERFEMVTLDSIRDLLLAARVMGSPGNLKNVLLASFHFLFLFRSHPIIAVSLIFHLSRSLPSFSSFSFLSFFLLFSFSIPLSLSFFYSNSRENSTQSEDEMTIYVYYTYKATDA